MSFVHKVFMVLTRATSIYIGLPLCSHFTSPSPYHLLLLLLLLLCVSSHRLHKVVPSLLNYPTTPAKNHFTAFSCQSFSLSCCLLARSKHWIVQCLFLAEERRSRTGDGRVRWSQVIDFYGGRGKFPMSSVSCLPVKRSHMLERWLQQFRCSSVAFCFGWTKVRTMPWVTALPCFLLEPSELRESSSWYLIEI